LFRVSTFGFRICKHLLAIEVNRRYVFEVNTQKFPKSPREMTKGMMYFPRMLDKIRMHLAVELHDDYKENFGAPGTGDSKCCNFLRVHHRDVIERVKQGGTDEEI
jgi:hypothetical protein